MIHARIKDLPAPSPVIERRSATDEDRNFLFELFCDSRTPDNTLLALPPEVREARLQSLFEASERQYRAAYPLADFEILLIDGAPAGNIYVDRGDDAYVLIDISLSPKSRNQGTGTAVVGNLIEEAGRLALPVRAQVQKFSPASRLWQRLGFERVGDDGLYYDIVVPAIRS